MQKRSHKLLASTLLENCNGFRSKRYELAFLFGSFEPDCNPLSYLKGFRCGRKFRGHNYSNSQRFICAHIRRLQRRNRWTLWQYYTLGKLTHYLADAFTYPHNDNYQESLIAHRQYEDALRSELADYLSDRALEPVQPDEDVVEKIQALHRQYMNTVADMHRDIRYIVEATSLLMAGTRPAAAQA